MTICVLVWDSIINFFYGKKTKVGDYVLYVGSLLYKQGSNTNLWELSYLRRFMELHYFHAIKTSLQGLLSFRPVRVLNTAQKWVANKHIQWFIWLWLFFWSSLRLCSSLVNIFFYVVYLIFRILLWSLLSLEIDNLRGLAKYCMNITSIFLRFNYTTI